MISVGLMLGLLALTPFTQSTAARDSQPRPSVAVPTDVEIVRQNGEHSRLGVDAIKKAATGPIERNGQQVPFTPLAAVLKAAGIAADARVRVSAAAARTDLTLQKGAKSPAFDTDHFGFIFNQEGLPVLTPKPGTPPATPATVSERPQVRGVVKIEVLPR